MLNFYKTFISSAIFFIFEHLKLVFEVIIFLITNMQKSALKIDWYHMLENMHFETQVKLFFANF
jgi:hypothetical protein